MNITTQTEKELLDEMKRGNVQDVVNFIPARYHEEELVNLLFIWSEYRNDPQKLVSEMNNHVAKLICEAAQNIEDLDTEQRERDCCRDIDDAYQEMRRDRMKEEGF